MTRKERKDEASAAFYQHPRPDTLVAFHETMGPDHQLAVEKAYREAAEVMREAYSKAVGILRVALRVDDPDVTTSYLLAFLLATSVRDGGWKDTAAWTERRKMDREPALRAAEPPPQDGYQAPPSQAAQ